MCVKHIMPAKSATKAPGCSHIAKEPCRSKSECVWVIDHGCRVRENVPLGTLAANRRKEAAEKKAASASAKKVSSKKPSAKKAPKKTTS